MNKSKQISRIAVICCVMVSWAAVVSADALYEFKFNDQTTANSGTLGGSATITTGFGGTPPAYITDTPDGSAYAMDFPLDAQDEAQYLTLPDSTGEFALSNVGDQMTLATWVYWDGNSGTRNTIVSKNIDADGWYFQILAGGELQFWFAASGSFALNGSVSSTDTVSTGEWTHVAMQWDSGSTLDSGDATGLNAKFFINGADAGISNTGFSGADRVLNATTSTILVGDTFNNGRHVMNASIDNFQMYDTLLTDGEVAALIPEPMSALLILASCGCLLVIRRSLMG